MMVMSSPSLHELILEVRAALQIVSIVFRVVFYHVLASIRIRIRRLLVALRGRDDLDTVKVLNQIVQRLEGRQARGPAGAEGARGPQDRRWGRRLLDVWGWGGGGAAAGDKCHTERGGEVSEVSGQ